MAKRQTRPNPNAAILGKKILSLSGPKGARVDIHLESLKVTASQKAALAKVLQSGDFGSLTKAEQNKLQNIKYTIPRLPGDPQALIVRFDWRWVRIDEPKMGLNDPGPFSIRQK